MTLTRIAQMTLVLLALAALPARSLCAGRPRPQIFDSDGIKIAYLDQGSGEPVVLIHGWLSSAGINWVLPGTFGLLAKDHRVIAMDVRGPPARWPQGLERSRREHH